MRVATGGRAELNCIANATPAAKVVWLKNSVPVHANPPFVLLTENALLIARVEIQVRFLSIGLTNFTVHMLGGRAEIEASS